VWLLLWWRCGRLMVALFRCIAIVTDGIHLLSAVMLMPFWPVFIDSIVLLLILYLLCWHWCYDTVNVACCCTTRSDWTIILRILLVTCCCCWWIVVTLMLNFVRLLLPLFLIIVDVPWCLCLQFFITV
jgi:hypothetical protein